MAKKEEKKEPLVTPIRVMEWIIYMMGYALVLLVVSQFFKSFQLDYSYYGLYAFLAVVIIYILNT